jgi:hypothetical protein
MAQVIPSHHNTDNTPAFVQHGDAHDDDANELGVDRLHGGEGLGTLIGSSWKDVSLTAQSRVVGASAGVEKTGWRSDTVVN